MTTSVYLVALPSSDRAQGVGEADLLAVLGSVEGLSLGPAEFWQEPALALEGEAFGPAYSVLRVEAQLGVCLEQARAAVEELDVPGRLGFDVNLVPAELAGGQKKLLVMDVDSTLIRQEVIDELAAAAGRGAEVAEVTERAMRGELDFEQSLRQRVSALEGLEAGVVAEVSASVTYSPGARRLVSDFLAAGHAVCVVSGGFVQVLEPLAEDLGLTRARANVLEIVEGRLTGKVVGDVVTAEVKRESIREWAGEFGVDPSQVLAVGDGANDILMAQEAALGVAFNAKPALAQVADARINVMRLDAVRHFVGL